MQLPASGCNGGDSCCTSSNKCGLKEGDCDSNRDCSHAYVCGGNNCSGGSFDSTDDCCYKPSKYPVSNDNLSPSITAVTSIASRGLLKGELVKVPLKPYYLIG